MKFTWCFAGCFCAIFAVSSLSLFAGRLDSDSLTPYQIIKPVAANLIDASGEIIAEDIGKSMYDGSGLSTDSPLTATHGTDSDTMWSADLQVDGPVSIQFDLGESYDIQEFWMWQFNDPAETDQGVKAFDIVFRDGLGEIIGEISGASLDRADGEFNLPYYFCPIIHCVQFVEFRLLENYGDAAAIGFSEVVFAGRLKNEIVPEPALSLISLSLCLPFLNRYRRKNR